VAVSKTPRDRRREHHRHCFVALMSGHLTSFYLVPTLMSDYVGP
jgi:hypothetical protein